MSAETDVSTVAINATPKLDATWRTTLKAALAWPVSWLVTSANVAACNGTNASPNDAPRQEQAPG